MPLVKALVAAIGIGKSTGRNAFRKSAKRWSGLWTLLLVFDIIRFVRRRRRKVVARRVLRDGDVLIVSSTVDPKKT